MFTGADVSVLFGTWAYFESEAVNMDLLEQKKRNQRWLIGQRVIAKVGQALDDLFRELAIEGVTADVEDRTPLEGDEFDSEINRMENSDWGDRWIVQRERVEQAVRNVVPRLPRTQLKRRAG